MLITPATLISITLFDDHQANHKIERTLTLGDFADEIRRTNRNGADTDAAKAVLPWVKMAQLGNARSKKGSLRFDRNVLSISGVELDYDEERHDFEHAVEAMIKANIGGLVYTSPSYTAERWRWRILCPTSGHLAPARRAGLVSRVNGAIGGGGASESWKLSQSYYFGSANNNPLHRVEIVEGEPIDLLDDLDLVAIGPPKVSGKGRGGAARPAHPLTSSDGHRSSPKGPAADDMLDVVSALMAIDNPPAADWERWSYIAMATFAATSGSAAGLAAFLAWSEKAGEAVFDRAATEKRWQDIAQSPPDGRIGVGTLYFLAREARPDWERPSEAKRRRDNGPGEPPPGRFDTEIPTDEPVAETLPAAFSEDQLALEFSAKHWRSLRYVALWGEWLQWTRARWCVEETLRCFELVRRICRAASAAIDDARLARTIAKSSTVAAVERLARGDRRQAMRVDQFDADDWRLNQPPPKETKT